MRLKEGSHINTSLMVLSKVIAKLSEASAKDRSHKMHYSLYNNAPNAICHSFGLQIDVFIIFFTQKRKERRMRRMLIIKFVCTRRTVMR